MSLLIILAVVGILSVFILPLHRGTDDQADQNLKNERLLNYAKHVIYNKFKNFKTVFMKTDIYILFI